jgi:type II secretory ATPase GspE/PulE/Tfp pilus assembly ATPase PilB-like protein
MGDTASIELKSFLTNHLILSTLYSNGAVTTIQRLRNLGISPNLLVETLTVIVSQGLVLSLNSHHHAKKLLTGKNRQ